MMWSLKRYGTHLEPDVYTSGTWAIVDASGSVLVCPVDYVLGLQIVREHNTHPVMLRALEEIRDYARAGKVPTGWSYTVANDAIGTVASATVNAGV
jgi:hypothetical protein